VCMTMVVAYDFPAPFHAPRFSLFALYTAMTK
jgi:hypothetical protein